MVQHVRTVNRLLPKRIDKTRWPRSVRFDHTYVPASVEGVAESYVIFTVIVKMRYEAASKTEQTKSNVVSNIGANCYYSNSDYC